MECTDHSAFALRLPFVDGSVILRLFLYKGLLRLRILTFRKKQQIK